MTDKLKQVVVEKQIRVLRMPCDGLRISSLLKFECHCWKSNSIAERPRLPLKGNLAFPANAARTTTDQSTRLEQSQEKVQATTAAVEARAAGVSY